MQLKPLLSRLFELGSNLIRRYPGTVALFGFVSGVASFVLVERHAGLAKVVALVMLVSWLWLVLESSLRRSLQRWFGWQVPQPLLRYATQMVHQESLFFIIPFFAITTTWNSGQALFTGLLGLAALVSLIDPLYYKWLAPRRWVYLGFHALTLFAVLLTALPIILHLSTPQSYQLALGVAVLLALPSLSGLFPRLGWRTIPGVLLLAVALVWYLGLVYLARTALPKVRQAPYLALAASLLAPVFPWRLTYGAALWPYCMAVATCPAVIARPFSDLCLQCTKVLR